MSRIKLAWFFIVLDCVSSVNYSFVVNGDICGKYYSRFSCFVHCLIVCEAWELVVYVM